MKVNCLNGNLFSKYLNNYFNHVIRQWDSGDVVQHYLKTTWYKPNLVFSWVLDKIIVE